MSDFWRAQWYAVRPSGNRKPVTYHCPVCKGRLPALTAHMLVFPDGDPSRRRHVHTDCVMSARKDGRLPFREDAEPARPGLLLRMVQRFRS